ncbi:DUF4304 domain-containing protein [Dongia sp. agr-C8]
MSKLTPSEIYDRVIDATAQRLSTSGFHRRGAILRKIIESNAAIIEFQKSGKTDRNTIFFTVNIGVVCGALLGKEGQSVTKSKNVDAHLRQRIGMLLPERPDKWWKIPGDTDADELAVEISNLIDRVAVPYLQQYLRTDALLDLWETGVSPGLTDTQRLRCLEKLNRERHRHNHGT